MNFIDKIKIKNNPNVIDFWNEKKINQEVIECAIRSGYKFNLSNKRLFDKYAVYINTFKYEPGYLQDEIKKVRENLTLELLFTTYGREAAIKIIKQDIELTKFVLKEHIFGLQETEIIQIIDENDELINLAIKNYLGLSNSSNKELAKYIANKKTPHELKEMGIKIRDLDKAFIETADPEKIKEMLYNGQDYLGIEDLYDIRKVIKENLEKFIFYIKEFKDIKTSIIQNDIWLDYIKYLKDNEIVYNDKLDRDVLYNREYLLMCLKLCPTIAEDSMVSDRILCCGLKLEEYPDYISEIAEKIIKEQIKFQEIPSCYQKCREIYENIIKVNPELLENANNRVGLKIITADMSDEEKLDYYRSIGHPFNANVVICNKELESNFLVVLECLKKDHMTLVNSEKEYTLEQYK